MRGASGQVPGHASGLPRRPRRSAANLQQYRNLGSALRLWARYEIAQENYEGAVLALQTGFGMGRHLTQGPTTGGVPGGSRDNGYGDVQEVEEFVQAGEAPNLYAALAALPKPFTDVEKVIESEKKAIPSEPPRRYDARAIRERLGAVAGVV